MSSMELAAVDENLYLAEAWLSELELVNDIDHAALPAILLPYSYSQESARFPNSEADTTNLGLRDEQLQMVRESMISAPHDHDDVAAAATTCDLQMSVNNVNPPPHRSSYLLDCSTRAMCKKVTLKEAVMYEAIEKLGGGEKGLHLLMDHVRSWIAAAERNCSTTSTTDQIISISDSLQQLCVKASDQASPPPPPPSTSPPLQLAGADHLYITDLAASHMSTSTQNAVSRYSCKAHRKRKRSSIANTTATETNYHTDSSSVYTRSSSYDHSCWNRIVTNPLQLEKRRLAGYNVYHSRSSMSRTSSTAAAATRAARKHRMAYQRQQLIGRSCAAGKQPAAAAINSSSSSDYAMQQQPTASAATGLAAPVAKKLLQQPVSSTANKQQYSRNQFFINSRQKQQGPSTGTLVLLLHKLLQPSDVTSLGRIVLPKKEAESCLPYLAVKEGMSLAMEDFDTGKTWKVRYRYWPNNRSRMYLIENTGVFVRSHQLEEGDLLILYRNVERNKIVIQGKKKTQSDGSCIGAAVKDEKLSAAAAAAAADAIATQDSGGLVMPRLDAKLQRMAVKWEQEITKDQASSQLQLHCPVSAVLETASHKAGDGTQFEDSSDLGDLMQGIFQDKKHGSSCGLAPGGQNFQQLLSFPSLKDSDLLMADVSHLPSWDVNSTAATAAVISKVEPDEMNSRVVPSNIASLESETSNQPRKGAKVAGAGT